MRRFGMLLVGLAVSAVACGGAKPRGSASPTKVLTAAEISSQSSPAVVRIEAGDANGSGFVVDPGGLIATNLHVVVGRKAISVKLHSGETYPVTHVVGIDPARDLAVLRIAPPKPLAAVRLGDSAKLGAGDQVVAIGNPLGVFSFSVTSGLVSQVRPVCTQAQVDNHLRNRDRYTALVAKLEAFTKCRGARTGGCEAVQFSDAEAEELEGLRCRTELTLLQISAPISQGSSGGPLFNQFGEVVGVTTAIIQGGQNINIAIPTNYVKPMLARPEALSLDEFAEKTKAFAEAPADDGVKVQRLVPEHAMAIFQGCKPEQIGAMVLAIDEAIDVGAPLYNKGEIEACFRIYEGTAIKFERDRACPGISAAFVDGLERAKTLESYKEKAWAMRDTFDGLVIVARKWAKQNPQVAPPAINR